MRIVHSKLGIQAFLLSLIWLSVNPSCLALEVTFSGIETGVASPRTFTGSFSYDPSKSVSATQGLFDFGGSGMEHEAEFKIGSGATVSGSGASCEPFRITTSLNSKKTIQLKATVAGSAITISLPTSAILNQNNLPKCGQIPSTPLAGSTIQITGATSFSGQITAVACN